MDKSSVAPLPLKARLAVETPLNRPTVGVPESPATPAMGPSTPAVVDPAPQDSSTAAARRVPKKIDVIGDQSDGAKLAADLPAAIAIPDDAQQWTKIYGESLVRGFHSTDWKDREQSLSAIQRSLTSSKFLAGKDPKAVYAATAEMLAKTLKDKVAPIFHTSLELVSLLLSSFSSQLPQAVLHASMDPLMPIIVHRCGNLNTRIHESSLQALLAVATVPIFGCSYVGPFALAELPKRNRDASQAAQMYGRLDLMCSLLAAFKTSQGLPTPDVMRFSKQGLENPDEKVRTAAIKVIVEVHKMQKLAGSELQLEKHLGAIKPALMQVLHRRFQEADSEMSSSEGDAAATAGASSREHETPAASSGIKVYGKSLPPLKGMLGHAPPMMMARGTALKPGTPDASAAPGSPLRGRPLGSPAGTPKRERTASARSRMPSSGSGPASPATPSGRSPLGPLPELSVPKYTQMMGSPTGGRNPHPPGSATGSTRLGTPQTPGALDDAEEQLIQYIMGDDQIMAH